MSYHLRIRFFLLCSLVLQANFMSAQLEGGVFAPIGATWYYSPVQGGPPWLADPLYAYFLVEKDTAMLGYEAKVIGCYVNEENQMVRVDSLTKYVATVGDKVYYKVKDEFVLLYDFGAQAGDTIHSVVEDYPIGVGCQSDFSQGDIEFSYVVDSVGLIQIDGEELRILYVHSVDHAKLEPNWVFWHPIVERIGPTDFGGFWWGTGEYCIPESGYVRCYIDSEISWRNPYFPDNLACDFISSSNEIKSDDIVIHPNPATTQVYLPQDAANVALYNLTGHKLPITNVENEIDVSSYPSGMYFVRFEIEGRVKMASFVKFDF